MSEHKSDILVQAEGLVKHFIDKGAAVQAVSNVNLTIYRGETLCLVGESGCGKSTLGRLLLRLIEPTAGKVVFDGEDISTMKANGLRNVRRKMQLIFQDPYASLDPRMSVGKIVGEPLKIHRVGDAASQSAKVDELLGVVGIPIEYKGRYPHQFSGGQRQRIGIARALALNPELVVCDEPVSALDVSIQAQILNLLHDLQQQYSLTYLFITHDLGVVRYIATRVCVMFLGKICEIGSTEEIFQSPRHPYTHFLLASTPTPDPTKRKEDKDILLGDVPSPINPPSGCRFHKRCPYMEEICTQKEPPLHDTNGHLCACHFPLPV